MIAATTKRTMLVAATAGAVLALAACGDDGEASGPSKEEYVASANEICVKGREGAEAAFEGIELTRQSTPADAQQALEGLLPVLHESFEGRAALEAPEGDEETVEAIDEAGAEALAEFDRAAADPEQSFALMSGRTPDPATEVDRLSAEYGITECAGKD